MICISSFGNILNTYVNVQTWDDDFAIRRNYWNVFQAYTSVETVSYDTCRTKLSALFTRMNNSHNYASCVQSIGFFFRRLYYLFCIRFTNSSDWKQKYKQMRTFNNGSAILKLDDFVRHVINISIRRSGLISWHDVSAVLAKCCVFKHVEHLTDSGRVAGQRYQFLQLP